MYAEKVLGHRFLEEVLQENGKIRVIRPEANLLTNGAGDMVRRTPIDDITDFSGTETENQQAAISNLSVRQSTCLKAIDKCRVIHGIQESDGFQQFLPVFRQRVQLVRHLVQGRGRTRREELS